MLGTNSNKLNFDNARVQNLIDGWDEPSSLTPVLEHPDGNVQELTADSFNIWDDDQ